MSRRLYIRTAARRYTAAADRACRFQLLGNGEKGKGWKKRRRKKEEKKGGGSIRNL